MKRAYFFTLILTFGLAGTALAQSFPNNLKTGGLKNPWTKQELMEPATLAALLKDPKAIKPVIFNIGVVEDIRGARNMGAANQKENLARFKSALKALPKTTVVVIYCGCCPFDRCPNIRPAFQALKDGGFTKGKLLNLPTNVKTNWINKGYPLERK